MKYSKLGRTGLDVSALCLGCMSFGDPNRGGHVWTLTEDESFPLIKQALEHGINFFDTANVYSAGSSEEIVGKALEEYSNRDEVVIATKVNGRMHEGPNGRGLSRKAILSEVEASLRRLGTDYIDLYQIHSWDPRTPIDETLEALHDVVRAGKVRYLGASNLFAWQFSKALYTAELRGWTKFVSMQDHYNLIWREEEREMIPLCRDQGIAVIPWSPLARGRLTRRWDDETERSRTDELGKKLYDTSASDRAIADRVVDLAAKRDVSPAQIALAWLRNKPGVVSPIVGATKPQHIDDAVASVDLELEPSEIQHLEELYAPHPIRTRI